MYDYILVQDFSSQALAWEEDQTGLELFLFGTFQALLIHQ